MKQEIIYSLNSPFRDEFTIPAFKFGNGEKTIAIVGQMRGDEVQQLFVCSQLIKNLIAIEQQGHISNKYGIMVIPSANNYSLNTSKRFWAMDNTDINRMFPGYDKGETTQRIASAIFEAVRGYEYGIQLASYYLNGNFVPHVRIMQTGYQNLEDAEKFGLPYTYIYKPKPFDTTVLNYNWQIFETKAYSIYSGSTNCINHAFAKTTWTSILRFLANLGIIKYSCHPGQNSFTIDDTNLETIISEEAGLLYSNTQVGNDVKRGDLLAKILDPYTGDTRSTILSPVDGTIFFSHTNPLINQHSRIFQIIKY